MRQDGTIFQELASGIIERSVAETWEAARLEWGLDSIYRQDTPETCLCGHHPIFELCELRNRINGNAATVGNVCVNRFIGLPSDLIFQGVRRVEKDMTKALNSAAVEYAWRRGWINAWEQGFCVNTARKRNLSNRQLATRIEINKKFLQNIRNR
jgi:hypothetical protein